MPWEVHGRPRHHDVPGAPRDGGFTLVELLLGMAIALLVGAAGLAMLDASAPLAGQELERQNRVGEAREGLNRMVRELRQADAINTTSSNLMDVDVVTRVGSRRVVYACNAPSSIAGLRSCMRYEGPVDGAVDSGRVVVDGIVNGTPSAPVFTYTPDAVRPTYTNIEIAVPAKGARSDGYQHAVTLRSGFFLRNIDLSGS